MEINNLLEPEKKWQSRSELRYSEPFNPPLFILPPKIEIRHYQTSVQNQIKSSKLPSALSPLKHKNRDNLKPS